MRRRIGKRAEGFDLRTGDRARLDVLQLALILMVFVSVWRIQNLVPVLDAIKIQYIAPALAILAYMVDHDPRRGIARLAGPVLYRVLGIGAMILLSVPTSLWPGRTADFFLDDFSKTLLLGVLIAASIRTPKDLERYAATHVLGAVVYSLYIVNNFRVSAKSGRLGSLIYYDSNDLGLLLVCTIPLCVYFLRPGSKPLSRIGALGALGLLVYTMVQTGSRGAFLGFIACATYLLFSFSAISKTVRTYAVGAIVAFLLLFGGPVYWDMMSSLLNPKQDYNWTADSGRKQVWKRGIGYMLTHPVTGVGGRAFPIAEGSISSLASQQAMGIGLKWSGAHNSFVEIGAELGVIGLFLFSSALLQAWRYVRRVGSDAMKAVAGPLAPMGHALGGVIISFVVAGFFVSASYSAFLYTVLAMIIGMMKLLPATGDAALAPQPVELAGLRAVERVSSSGRSAGRARGTRHPGPAPVARGGLDRAQGAWGSLRVPAGPRTPP